MASPRLLWADTFEGSGGQVELGPQVLRHTVRAHSFVSMVAMHKKSRRGCSCVYFKDCAAICDMAPVR